jgi:quercetin dioxygenase-like cupin family protein
VAYAGKKIYQTVAGEHGLFLKTAADTNGEFMLLEVTMDPKGFVTVEHTHPLQQESFEILQGTVLMTINGKEQVVKAGESRVVPAGTSHVWRNYSDTEEAKARVEFRPAGQIEYLFENGAGLSGDGKVDPKSGLPNLLQIAVFAIYYGNDMRMSKPPWWIQKILFSILYPFAWLLGYRAKYPKYTN